MTDRFSFASGKELLIACCVCKKIRIDDKSDFWLSREKNLEVYDSITNKYGNRISHGYCPIHFQEAMRKLEEYKRNHPKD